MLSRSRLKNILSLRYKKFRKEHQLFLIEGFRLCQEALQSDFIVETLLINPDILSPVEFDAMIQLAQSRHIEIVEIKQNDVKRLAETVNSQGVFCIVQQRWVDGETILDKKNQLLVIIDAGQDPGNIGTIIRTSDWFGVDAILLSRATVELYNPKLVRSTMGSIFHVPIIPDVDLQLLLPQLKQSGCHIFGCDVKGEFNYNQIDYPRPTALVFGNENVGISPALYHYFDKTVKIPCYGRAESLNLATAAAIIISRVVTN